MPKVAERRTAVARKAAAATLPISKTDSDKVRSILRESYGTVRVATLTATEKPHVFKVVGAVDYPTYTALLKATVNTNTEGVRGNIPIDP